MIIKTERLVLAPVDLSYAESTFSYAGNVENTKYMMFLPYDSLEETEAAIRDSMNEWESETPARWEFVMLLDGKHIGGMTFYFLDDRSEAELGWVVHRDYWSRGYATEAARELIRRAGAEWGIRRVIACCDSENMGSRCVMEKLGMTLSCEGKRKNRSSDEERTELIYEILI